jgi:hypothetical protein
MQAQTKTTINMIVTILKKTFVVEDHNAMVLYLFTRGLTLLKKTHKCLMF